MNTFSLWKSNDIFRTKLRARNKRLLSELQKSDLCEFILFQEAWTKTTTRVLSKYDNKSSLYTLRNRNERRFNIGLSNLITEKVDVSEGYTFFRNAPGRSGQIRNLPFVNIKKGFNYFALANDLSVINLHLHPYKSRDDVATRISHVLDLIEFFIDRKLYSKPMIFAGDFNSSKGDIAFDLLSKVLVLKDSYLEVNSDYTGICTHCKTGPRNSGVIDYILYKNGYEVSIKPTFAEVNLISRPDFFMSDHNGVRLLFDLEATAKNKRYNRSLENDAREALLKTQSYLETFSKFNREKSIIEDLINKLSHDSDLVEFYRTIN